MITFAEAARTILSNTPGVLADSPEKIDILDVRPDVYEITDRFGNEVGARDGLSVVYKIGNVEHWHFFEGDESSVVEEAEEILSENV